MKTLALVFIFAATLAVSACNTVEGVGKDVSSAGEGISSGSNATKQFPMTVKETLEECSHALRVLAPGTYGRRRRITTSFIHHLHP
jgi:predicted small secreted protein